MKRLPGPRSLVVCWALATALLAPLVPRSGADEPTLIRLLPLLGEPARGKVTAAALVLEKSVQTVIFYLDDERIDKRRFPPFETDLTLADPPRPQVLRAEALDADGRVVGRDRMVVNRRRVPLRVDIRSLQAEGGSLRVEAQLSVPGDLRATGVAAYLNEAEVETRGTPFGSGAVAAADSPAGDLAPPEIHAVEFRLPRPDPRPNDYVRVVLELADGRTVEDVELIESPGFEEEVAVHLVQLQMVATEPSGRPLKDLEIGELELFENGEMRQVAGLFLPDDVSLVLGLAVDASASMEPVWAQTHRAARLFLEEALTARDRGFLVDFDADVRLTHSLTSDVPQLLEALERIRPAGNTALFDSILFSLLQFERQPGRRGLVVISDGADSQSLTDPRRTVAAARQLGVPVYVIALESQRGRPRGPLSGALPEAQSLHLLTEPSGGRLYRSPSLETARRALLQIREELRSQYVLTYYSERSADDPLPEVRVRIPGRKGVKVKTVFGADQID